MRKILAMFSFTTNAMMLIVFTSIFIDGYTLETFWQYLIIVWLYCGMISVIVISIKLLIEKK